MGNWTETQTRELKDLYVEANVPSDQLLKDKTTLDTFVRTFNSRLDGNAEFTAEEMASKLLRLRKSGKLPRIRR
jgi:hypothetical protein